jgi:hypothetical protein
MKNLGTEIFDYGPCLRVDRGLYLFHGISFLCYSRRKFAGELVVVTLLHHTRGGPAHRVTVRMRNPRTTRLSVVIAVRSTLMGHYSRCVS